MIHLLAILLIASAPEPVHLNDLARFPDFELSTREYDRAVTEASLYPMPEAWQHPFPQHYEQYYYYSFRKEAWDLLTDAQMKHYSITNRECKLRKLRNLIGMEWYYWGRMP